MIRTILLAVFLVGWAALAEGQTRVRPYFRTDGAYVSGHYRSSPNSSRMDNWSTYPNINPYTGRFGTRDSYAIPAPSYRPTYRSSSRDYYSLHDLPRLQGIPSIPSYRSR